MSKEASSTNGGADRRARMMETTRTQQLHQKNLGARCRARTRLISGVSFLKQLVSVLKQARCEAGARDACRRARRGVRASADLSFQARSSRVIMNARFGEVAETSGEGCTVHVQSPSRRKCWHELGGREPATDPRLSTSV